MRIARFGHPVLLPLCVTIASCSAARKTDTASDSAPDSAIPPSDAALPTPDAASTCITTSGVTSPVGVHAQIRVGGVLRNVPPTAFVLNLTTDHENNFDDASVALWREIGVRVLRWPGGSNADSFDFSASPDSQHESTADFARLAERLGADAIITLNYGSGSPQMAAAFAAYLNGRPEDATMLGVGKRATNGGTSWADYDWKTAGYWATLRGQSPLSVDDGLNHLRAAHPAPWNFHYFELGNEVMGHWENDLRPSGQQQSPYLYAEYCQQTAALLKKIDSAIKVGIVAEASEDSAWRDADSAPYTAVVNPATGELHAGWNAILFSELQRRSFVPDFLVDHFYAQSPGQEDDAKLLAMVSPPSTARAKNGSLNWAGRSNDYKTMLSDYFGGAAANVAVYNTEHNSVASNPGKQSTSLVNALFYLDSFGAVTRTEIGGFAWWQARSSATNGNASNALYGWRMYGDYGLMGDDGYVYFGDGNPLPGRDSATPYPTFFAAELASLFVSPGDAIVSTTSDSTLVSIYAAHSSASLKLLVVNKSPTDVANVGFNIDGFCASGAATQYAYGKSDDDQQARGQAVSVRRESLQQTGSQFVLAFAPYSMSVLVLDGR